MLILNDAPDYGLETPENLNRNGFVWGKKREKTEINPSAVIDAILFIQANFYPRATINKTHSSSYLKHLIEPYTGYISNGDLIVAMSNCDYEILRFGDSCNCFFNVSKKSIKKVYRISPYHLVGEP